LGILRCDQNGQGKGLERESKQSFERGGSFGGERNSHKFGRDRSFKEGLSLPFTCRQRHLRFGKSFEKIQREERLEEFRETKQTKFKG
jgi:hypothetical protein